MNSDTGDAAGSERRIEFPLSTAARLVGAGMVAAGAAHLLRPGTLLETGRVAYGRILDVGFEPRDSASRRVRVVGAAMVAAGAHLVYHGGLSSRDRDE